MIESRSGPCDEARMAGVALRSRWNMRDRFCLRVLCQIASVVTRRTLPVQSGVIHGCRCKRDRVFVTHIA